LGTGTNSAEIFRRPVTQLEYVDEETLVSGSEDGTMRVWSVATGTQKEELDGEGFSKEEASVLMKKWWRHLFPWVLTQPASAKGDKVFSFSKDSSLDQKVGKYNIAFKKDLLLISEGQSVVAFFRAPQVISSIGTAGERIGVGCENGEVLQLRAPWLVYLTL
jgi:hypothetical protein